MTPEEQKAIEDRTSKAKQLLADIATWNTWVKDLGEVTSVTLKKPMLSGEFRDVDIAPWGKKDRISDHGKAAVGVLIAFGETEIKRIQAEYDAL